MYKMMVKVAAALGILFMGGCSQQSEPTAEASVKQPDLIIFEYKVTDVSGDEYLGEAADGTGIYFLSENIRSGEDIQVGDDIQAVFYADNQVDGLVEVFEKN